MSKYFEGIDAVIRRKRVGSCYSAAPDSRTGRLKIIDRPVGGVYRGERGKTFILDRRLAHIVPFIVVKLDQPKRPLSQPKGRKQKVASPKR